MFRQLQRTAFFLAPLQYFVTYTLLTAIYSRNIMYCACINIPYTHTIKKYEIIDIYLYIYDWSFEFWWFSPLLPHVPEKKLERKKKLDRFSRYQSCLVRDYNIIL